MLYLYANPKVCVLFRETDGVIVIFFPPRLLFYPSEAPSLTSKIPFQVFSFLLFYVRIHRVPPMQNYFINLQL